MAETRCTRVFYGPAGDSMCCRRENPRPVMIQSFPLGHLCGRPPGWRHHFVGPLVLVRGGGGQAIDQRDVLGRCSGCHSTPQQPTNAPPTKDRPSILGVEQTPLLRRGRHIFYPRHSHLFSHPISSTRPHLQGAPDLTCEPSSCCRGSLASRSRTPPPHHQAPWATCLPT